MEGNSDMKVQILSANVIAKDIPAKGDRAAMSFREQQAAIVRDDGFPKPFRISLQHGQYPYPPGFYTFTTDSFVTDEYERIKFGRNVALEPIPQAPAGKA